MGPLGWSAIVVLLFASYSSKCQKYVDITLLIPVSLSLILLVPVSVTSSLYFSLPLWTHRHTKIHTNMCTHAHFWLNVIHP